MIQRGSVFALGGVTPKIAGDVFLAPGAMVIGDVEIGPGSSVWFNAVIRGDSASIRIGAGTNIQDGAILHIDRAAPCIVGDRVTIGHGAIVHGATVEDEVTIGMGAVVLSRSHIGRRAVIAAGAVVAEGTVVPEGALMVGIPAVVKRILDEPRQAAMTRNSRTYIDNAIRFGSELRVVEEAE